MNKKIYLAGGCFWGLQHYFDQAPGILATEVGYANANKGCPTYEEVCTGQTDAAETVEVTYDDAVITLPAVLDLFFHAVDPTQVNRQGNDIGTQYRSGIYSTDPEQLRQAEAFVAQLQQQIPLPVATEVKLLTAFAPAETYHQKYLDKHPTGYCHIGKEEFDYARNYKISEA